MENSIETIVNNMLEKLSQGYNNAMADWKADRRNPFKDGKFLGYYEAKEILIRCLDAGDAFNAALEQLASLYNNAMVDWKADRHNPFKDGKFLACFEVLKMIPAAS